MPLFGLGVCILWLGWFGFNPGSTLNALDAASRRSLLVTLLAAARGRARRGRDGLLEDEDDRHRHGRQRHDRRARRDHGALGLRRAVGGAGHRPRRRRHRAARRLRDRQAPRRPGRRADGARHGGIWGTLSCGLFTLPALAEFNTVGDGRPGLHGLVRPARRPGARRRDRVRVRVRHELRGLLGHQEDLRAAGHRGGGGRRPGHLRARHVRLPGAVHPGAGARRLRCGSPVRRRGAPCAPPPPTEVPA